MATAIIMPRQGQSVESCILTLVNKQKGDNVKHGDILFAYETDKAAFEELSSVEGEVLEVFFTAGDEVPVLTNVIVIGQAGESFEEYRPGGAKQPPTPAIVTPEVVAAGVTSTVETPAGTKRNESAGVSPRARGLAKKVGVNVENIVGTGPNGRVIECDVQAAAAAISKVTPLAKQVMVAENTVPAKSGTGLAGSITAKDLTSVNPAYANDSEVKPLTNIRKLIAKAMHASLQNSAQLTHHLGADARRLMEMRKKVKAAVEKGYPTNITLNDMVCFAVIKALKKFPQVNSHFMGDSMRIFNKVHIGLAVDTDRGLLVPVVKNADDLSIAGLANQFKEVANACRKGSISPELLASDAASFTVSNLGSYGVEMFTPVINLPQTAILGVNAIVPRPKDLGDGIYAFVPYMGLSLTYDHRALDGGEATRFVKQVAIEIENLEFDI